MSQKYLIWCGVMFSYGFYRQWKTEMREPFNLYGYRFIGSIANGFVYMSPLGISNIFNLINRIDIYYNKLNKEKYPAVYEELLGSNYNTL
jgi:hypothetical protein